MPKTRAEAETEITKRINKLTSQIGGNDRLQAEASLSRLENDMDNMSQSIKNTASAFGNMPGSVKPKRDYGGRKSKWAESD